MAVEIYVWRPKLPIGVGHAAIKVDGGDPKGTLYLSRWPDSVVAATVFFIGNGVNQRYEEDVTAEGGKPEVVRLTKLDESAIKTAIEQALKGKRYSFLAFNCATQVRMCLDAGLSLVDKTIECAQRIMTPYHISQYPTTSTPWGLYVYAKALASKYA